jgi:hypothetical protein
MVLLGLSGRLRFRMISLRMRSLIRQGTGSSIGRILPVIDDEARTYTVRERDPHDDNYGYNVISYDTLAQVLVGFAFTPEKYGVAPDSDWVEWARVAIFELETGEEFPGGTLDSEITDAIVQVAAFGSLIYG